MNGVLTQFPFLGISSHTLHCNGLGIREIAHLGGSELSQYLVRMVTCERTPCMDSA